ncbi:hypothetical protein Glove_115g59 [Diversispora epigaea]|uniref:Uncharacterized protein n=1 Tax=Diversispora epigaea TaxID=1348612 RepID=A0A397JB07_9GLOM|nr:hypothetical protein Glove_115g59 [Diversispora epigaea]
MESEQSSNIYFTSYEQTYPYSEFFEIENDNINDNINDFISINKENYSQTLNSLINEEQDIIIQSDAEDSEDDINSEQEIKEFSLIIDLDTNNELTSCVLVDIIDGKLQTCGANSKKRLRELIGLWQVDNEILNQVNNDLSRLGICMPHFNFDQKIHNKKSKSQKNTQQSHIQFRQCLFCCHNHYYFSRGTNCNDHSWNILDRVILTPCIGQINCIGLKEYDNICKKTSENIYRPRFICVRCFEQKGGHHYIKPGKGKKPTSCNQQHIEDTSQQLKIIGKWLISVGNSDENKFQNLILSTIAPSIFCILKNIDSNQTSTSINIEQTSNSLDIDLSIPSLLQLQIIFQLKKIKINTTLMEDLNIKYCENLGKEFGNKLWKSRKELVKSREVLQNPSTLNNYISSFPVWLESFFRNLLIVIYEKKSIITNKKQLQRKRPIKSSDLTRITKVVSLFLSILISITFPSIKVWFSQVISSLTRKPKMTTYLTELLSILKITSHSNDHERILEKKRMNEANPISRLQKTQNIWNLAVIDNIDFKQKTFTYGNIFDVTRDTSHTTLRMAFQTQLPIPIDDTKNNEKELTSDHIFGMNESAYQILKLFDKIFDECLAFDDINGELKYNTNFDATTIHNKILEKLTHGCFCSPSHVIILEAGGIPNSNEGIYQSVDMYKKDFSLNSDDYLDIVGDESIFRRLINIMKEWPNLRPILGMWHTNKDMASAIIAIFSSYGIFDLGVAIGVKFLDKFEKVVDYRATVKIIELIWVAVGIALRIYLKLKNLHINNILDGNYEENQVRQIWYLFYHWAGLFLAHKAGIRIGNYNIQKSTLAAFAPLFPVAGKSNYSQSVAHFFGILEKYPKLEEKLQYVPSFKVSEDKRGHFLAFDEALEMFGVKFIKQNINGNVIDPENLKRQIKAAQIERERIEMLLNEYLNNVPEYNYNRSVYSRKEAMWDVVNNLLKAFDIQHYNKHNNNLFHITKPKEICAEGVKRLKESYGQGLRRIRLIYSQEVLKKETINTVGRRAKEVIVTKYKDIGTEKNKRKKSSEINVQTSTSVSGTSSDPVIISPDDPPQKKTRRIPSKEAIQILAPMVMNSFPPTKEEIKQYLITLEGNVPISDVWDEARVMQHYKNRHKKTDVNEV